MLGNQGLEAIIVPPCPHIFITPKGHPTHLLPFLIPSFPGYIFLPMINSCDKEMWQGGSVPATGCLALARLGHLFQALPFLFGLNLCFKFDVGILCQIQTVI